MSTNPNIFAIKHCIAIYDSAQDAERHRLALLDTGVRYAWADDTKDEIAGAG